MPTRPLARRYVRTSNRRPDVNAFITAWQADGDEGAREAVFDQYFPLARRLARRYRTPHEPLEDLNQVAAVGLLGAIDRLDPSRGAAYGSSASRCQPAPSRRLAGGPQDVLELQQRDDLADLRRQRRIYLERPPVAPGV